MFDAAIAQDQTQGALLSLNKTGDRNSFATRLFLQSYARLYGDRRTEDIPATIPTSAAEAAFDHDFILSPNISQTAMMLA
ncbi:MAG TPA: hypothetical protein VMQ93_18970 [Novosphingobium sp.]|nr:hypothetical protein [Novosphingobium sp.]